MSSKSSLIGPFDIEMSHQCMMIKNNSLSKNLKFYLVHLHIVRAPDIMIKKKYFDIVLETINIYYFVIISGSGIIEENI